jgi:hypothetical protein
MPLCSEVSDSVTPSCTQSTVVTDDWVKGVYKSLLMEQKKRKNADGRHTVFML